MIYFFGIIVWLEICLLFEDWATRNWSLSEHYVIQGPLYRFFMVDEEPSPQADVTK